MQIDYDPEADALYIQLREGDVDDTLEIGKYIYADVDQDGLPLGVEIVYASRVLSEKDVTSVTVNIRRAVKTAA